MGSNWFWGFRVGCRVGHWRKLWFCLWLLVSLVPCLPWVGQQAFSPVSRHLLATASVSSPDKTGKAESHLCRVLGERLGVGTERCPALSMHAAAR